MANVEKTPNDFTVHELKEILRDMDLSTKGSKTELIARIMDGDPTGEWMLRVPGEREGGRIENLESANRPRANSDNPELLRREIELCRREKEVMERELLVAQREIESLRRSQNANNGGRGSASDAASRSPAISHEPAMNVNAIAGLLGYFEGDGNMFEAWEKRIKSLRDAYGMTDDLVRIMIGSRLKGKAQEWFHSNPNYTEITVDELLSELKIMFFHVSSKVHMRRQFEQNAWRRDETFSEYLHQKVIMGNRIEIDEGEMVEYIIEGIPDPILRDQVRVQRLRTRGALLEAFERVSLRGRSQQGPHRSGREQRAQGGSERENQDAARGVGR